jgi:methylated-DNA-[protein]-cysteine S-methyltransferase
MLTVLSDGTNISCIRIAGQKYFTELSEKNAEKHNLPLFDELRLWFEIYFSGQKPNFMPPITLRGSMFRMSVWKLLREIPYGQTTTYGDVANLLEKENKNGKVSARAIGNAVGHNPIPILIPCHRVIAKNGSLTGYAGGIDIKVKLLSLEGITKFRR